MNLRKKFVHVSAGGLTEKFIHRQNNKVLKRHMPKKKCIVDSFWKLVYQFISFREME